MRILSSTVDRQTRIAGIVGSMLVASVLTSGAVAAADPSPDPQQGGVQVTTDAPGQAQGGTIVVSNATAQALPAFGGPTPASCATVQVVGTGVDGSQTVQTTGPDAGCGSGTVILGGPGMPFGGPDMTYGGPGMMGGMVSIAADAARIVTVTAVNGDVVSLKTDDGWTRDLDTKNVVITLDKDTLTAADLAVGDRVLVDQVQNANDTWTITGLELQLPEVMGAVTEVTADGFTVAGLDGTTTTVRVSDATTWPTQMMRAPGATTGLESVKVGDFVDVRGKKAADGSIDAHSVLLQASMISFGTGDPGAPVPAPQPVPPTPQVAPTPETSPAP